MTKYLDRSGGVVDACDERPEHRVIEATGHLLVAAM
jgi:hypothetical protein